MDYTNVTPDEKFGIVTIKLGQQVSLQVMQCNKSAFEDVPLPARLSVILAMLVYKLITDNGTIDIPQALAEAGWTGAGYPESEGGAKVEGHGASNPTKGVDLVERSLAWLKTEWTYDHAIAHGMLLDREAALFVVAPGAVSDTGLAFAPEGSKGFIRDLQVSRSLAGRSPVTEKPQKDPVAFLMSILTGQSPLEGLDINIASKEAEFPVHNQPTTY